MIILNGTPALTGRWALPPHKDSFLSVDALVCGGAANKAPDSLELKDRAVEVVGHYDQ